MSALAKIDVPYVNGYKDRHGRQRYYFRRKGFKALPLRGEPGSIEFARSYEEAKGTAKPAAALAHEGPGSIGVLIEQYFLSTDFRALSYVTQKGHRSVLKPFREKHGHRSVHLTSAADLNNVFHGMAATPARASNLRKRLRPVFDLAESLGWIPMGTNPAKASRKVKYRAEGFTPWTDEDIAAFEEKWASGTRERLALYLLLYTGQRRSDVVTMGRQHIEHGRISVVQQKTKARLKIKMHPALRKEVELAPRSGLALLQTQAGKPFSAAGFTAWFVARAVEAGLEGKSPHGLRKAAGRRLAEVGCAAKEIAAVLGHRSLSMVELYTRDADQVLLADGAIDNLERGQTGSTQRSGE
jgi:integrase